MADYYGVVSGRGKGVASRTGTKKDGILTTAAHKKGAIQVHLMPEPGTDRIMFLVKQITWTMPGEPYGAGVEQTLLAGYVGELMKLPPEMTGAVIKSEDIVAATISAEDIPAATILEAEVHTTDESKDATEPEPDTYPIWHMEALSKASLATLAYRYELAEKHGVSREDVKDGEPIREIVGAVRGLTPCARMGLKVGSVCRFSDDCTPARMSGVVPPSLVHPDTAIILVHDDGTTVPAFRMVRVVDGRLVSASKFINLSRLVYGSPKLFDESGHDETEYETALVDGNKFILTKDSAIWDERVWSLAAWKMAELMPDASLASAFSRKVIPYLERKAAFTPRSGDHVLYLGSDLMPMAPLGVYPVDDEGGITTIKHPSGAHDSYYPDSMAVLG